MQLFQIMPVKWGEAVNHIPAAGTGEDSGTEQGILTCATWPRSIAIRSHLFALIAIGSLHLQKTMCNPEPLPGDKITSRITSLQQGGETNNVTPNLCSQVQLISKVN